MFDPRQRLTASPNIHKRNRQLAVTYGTGRRTFRREPAHSAECSAVSPHTQAAVPTDWNQE